MQASGSAPSEPGLAIRGLRPVVDGLRRLGHDPAPILDAAGLGASDWDDPDARVPTSAAFAMWESAVRITGDAEIGLHVALAAEISSFDVSAYVMLASPTLGAAYERIRRYQRLIHSTTRVLIEPAPTDGFVVLRHVLPGGLAVPRQTAEFLLAIWVRGGRQATGVDWKPEEVRFAHPRPASVRELERFFGSTIRFTAGENALVLAAALLETPCVRADPALLTILERHVGELLARIPRTPSLADRVRVVVAEELRHGEPSAARIAERLKSSVRTLQRGLAAEGTSLFAILDGIRHQLAVRHLAERRLSISEVAFLLGYEELSSFYRAFRRWTGATPAEFRAASSARAS